MAIPEVKAGHWHQVRRSGGTAQLGAPRAHRTKTKGDLQAKERQEIPLFPMFVKLGGRPCLVVGAGHVAESKTKGLLAAGASVRVVGRRATRTVKQWASKGQISWEERDFDPDDLKGIFLVVAATSSTEINDGVYREARRRKMLCNVVDDPLRCDFYYPSVVRRGPLQIAISTAGHSPALAMQLRQRLERQFGPEYETWVQDLAAARHRVFSCAMDPRRRRRLLHRLASAGPPKRPRKRI